MKDLKKYLLDILNTISVIEEISASLTIQDMDNASVRWALERGISIIGEAVYQADKLQKGLAITNLVRIKNTRHIIVHDYDIVDRQQIFIIVQKHLPLLKSEVENILKNLA